MKVANLLKDTLWIPGSNRTDSPIISVLMPTFRRGSDGMFLQAARSVLDQSFKNLELIIVDDASSDGTAYQIDQLMAEDGRVSCLRHLKNVGLPAVSEYEAFIKARGEYIAFSFDDFVFFPNALQRLHAEIVAKNAEIGHGWIEYPDGRGNRYVLGRDLEAHDRLLFTNFIANASVLAKRSVFEDVGLYDPHIGLSRVCDWDLWRRVHRKYPLLSTDVYMGEERGAARGDSLGNTYPMRFEVSQEFMGQARDEALRPANFPNRDVWSVPPHASYALTAHVLEARRFFDKKFWGPRTYDARFDYGSHGGPRSMAKGLLAAIDRIVTDSDGPVRRLFNKPRPVVTIMGTMDASISLAWTGDERSKLNHLNFVEPTGFCFYESANLLQSDVVVFSRTIMNPDYKNAIDTCIRLQIPHFYYIDDNFPKLASQVPELKSYTADSLRYWLTSFDGVIVTSQSLKDYFLEHNLHRRVELVDIVYNSDTHEKCRKIAAKSPLGPELKVAFFGGVFRQENFSSAFLPALAELERSSKLLVRDVRPKKKLPKHIKVSSRPSTQFFDRFLEDWAAFAPHIVVHPRGTSTNIDSKTANALLVSLYLGAVPVVCDEPAYADVGEAQGIVKVDGTQEGWLAALKRLDDPALRAKLLKRLGAHCRARYGAGQTIKVIENLPKGRRPLGASEAARRYRWVLQFAHDIIGQLHAAGLRH